MRRSRLRCHKQRQVRIEALAGPPGRSRSPRNCPLRVSIVAACCLLLVAEVLTTSDDYVASPWNATGDAEFVLQLRLAGMDGYESLRARFSTTIRTSVPSGPSSPCGTSWFPGGRPRSSSEVFGPTNHLHVGDSGRGNVAEADCLLLGCFAAKRTLTPHVALQCLTRGGPSISRWSERLAAQPSAHRLGEQHLL